MRSETPVNICGSLDGNRLLGFTTFFHSTYPDKKRNRGGMHECIPYKNRLKNNETKCKKLDSVKEQGPAFLACWGKSAHLVFVGENVAGRFHFKIGFQNLLCHGGQGASVGHLLAVDCHGNFRVFHGGKADESTVVEKVTTPTSPSNQPNRGLTLTAKALARQKSRSRTKKLEIIEKKED